MLSNRCPVLCLSCPVLSVLSVTFLHCGQTVGRIKMKLAMRVGIDPRHVVLDVRGWGSGARLPPWGGESLAHPNFRLMFIASKRLDG